MLIVNGFLVVDMRYPSLGSHIMNGFTVISLTTEFRKKDVSRGLPF
jgi:hypothetical protein